jgi:excisionase family DNA binding protein
MEKQPIIMFNDEGIKVLIEQLAEKLQPFLKTSNSTQEIEKEPFISLYEVSKILNLKKATIYGYTHKGTIPFRKQGKRLLFLKSEIYAWVNEGKNISKNDLEMKADAYLLKNKI